jgi:methionyl-tRNA formyltransferase
MSFNVIFMGTPEFSLPALEELIKNNFNILKIYTQPAKKSKRGQRINVSPIEEFSRKKSLSLRSPSSLNNDEEIKFFKGLSPDLVVVVAYGQIIPKNFLEIPKFGFINIHASLLPRWRGAAPIQRAIMNKDKKIGVSIMKIEEKLDSGPVLSSKEMELNHNSTYGEIEKKLSIFGANLLVETLKKISVGKVEFKKQDTNKVTYAKKISKDETRINWNLEADKIIAHIHGLSPNPGAWFEHKGDRFKVFKATKSSLSEKPGTVIDENLNVACKSNSIQILELQKQGKNKQTVKEFLLGYKINKGEILV